MTAELSYKARHWVGRKGGQAAYAEEAGHHSGNCGYRGPARLNILKGLASRSEHGGTCRRQPHSPTDAGEQGRTELTLELFDGQ